VNERDAFWEAIAESPDDPLPWLLFADWLESRGEDYVAARMRDNAAALIAPSDEHNVPFDAVARAFLQNPATDFPPLTATAVRCRDGTGAGAN
jgi:uncharacterized protein (TIGR02996 family)